MGKPSGDVHLFLVFFAQADAKPLVQGRRFWPHIHRYVEHFALNYAHEFALGLFTGLEMHAAQYTLGAARLVVLHKLGIDAGFGKGPLVPRLEKVAALVAENAGSEDLKTGNWGGRKQG